jgi:hypothetical protein
VVTVAETERDALDAMESLSQTKSLTDAEYVEETPQRAAEITESVLITDNVIPESKDVCVI